MLVIGDGVTSCWDAVNWRIVLIVVTLVQLVLWLGCIDNGCNLITQTIHSPRYNLQKSRTTFHSQQHCHKCSYI